MRAEKKDRHIALQDGDLILDTRTREEAQIRQVTAERDYLWRALADLEVWVKTSPPDVIRFRKLIEAALDGFKPALKTERVAP